MSMRFETGDGNKMLEEDSWEHGCVSGTARSWVYAQKFKAGSLDELISMMKDHFDVESSAILIDSCDENGRIDVQRMENGQSNVPCESEISEWKKGKLTLWCVTYTYYVEVIDRRTVKLSPILKYSGVDR
jgi:hypothetical protein